MKPKSTATICKTCNRQAREFFKGHPYCIKHLEFISRCIHCKKEFMGKRRGGRFCSPQCQTEDRKLIIAKIKSQAVIFTKRCSYCGQEFKFKALNDGDGRKYCSKKCSKLASTKKQNIGRWTILDRDNFTCLYCGKNSFSDQIELAIDHIQPRNLGGESIAANLAVTCIDCNSSKGTKTIFDPAPILREVERRNKEHGISQDTKIKLGRLDD